MRGRLGLSLCALVMATSGAGNAQAQGLGLDVEAGYFDMTSARNSARAVFGSPGGFVAGGALRYELLGGRVPLRAGVRFHKREGERVFVADPSGPVFPLGHPLEVQLTPIYGTIGYRFGDGLLRPYVAAGAGMTRFKEESIVAGLRSSTTATKFTGVAAGGVELSSGRFRLAAEATYMTVPDTIGLAGVSEVYGETNVGGLSFVGRLIFQLGGS